MGFEPIIQNDGSWVVGAANRLTYLDRFAGLPVFYQNSGTRTLDSNFWRVVPANTLAANQIFLVYFNWQSTGAPWILNCTTTFCTVLQNGDSTSQLYMPAIMHADNGSSIRIAMRAGTHSGHQTCGLEVYIEGQDGRVGSWTVYLYYLGAM